jgi:DNA repair protein RadC
MPINPKYLENTMNNDSIITEALRILEDRMKYTTTAFTSSSMTKNYLTLKLADKEREEFHVLFLNSQHELIESQCMFQGTIDAARVWPREIAREALKLNASALLLSQ